jgi:hypothetical protein
MMDFQVNTFKNCKSPWVEDTIAISLVLNEIQSGEKYGYLISMARENGPGTPEFDRIKVGEVPSYTVNATFDGKRNKDSLIRTTGLLYLDIDGETEVDISNPYIYATYKSFSGRGRSIVVRVEGMTPENVKLVYHFAGQLLGVKPDPLCADIARQVVLSYDPNLVVNQNSEVIDVSGLFPNEDISVNYCSPTTPNKKPSRKRYNKLPPEKKERRSNDLLYPFSEEKLRWNNLDEYEIEGDYLIFDGKEPVVVVFVPEVIYKGSRYKTVSLLIHNLCYLNPWLDERRIYGLVKTINQRCEEPLGKAELLKIHADIVEKIKEGKLEPIYTGERKIIFCPNCPDHKKRKMMGVASGMVRRDKTLEKIQNALNDWDLNFGKVTNKKLAEAAGVHPNTIKKHLRSNKELSEQKSAINKEVKG